MSPAAGNQDRPSLIIHADWGSHPGKRWMASARLSGNSYQVKPVKPVGELADFLQQIRTQAETGGSILLGFDFPIGLPYAYAQKADLHNFISALAKFGQGAWQDFYNVCSTVDQISIFRPFYPYRPGGTSRQFLLDELGFHSINELRRECEKAPPQERAAAPLFWTLGAQQVGKAALNGWEQVIVPGLNDPSLDTVIWPFSGKMSELLRPGRIVIAETYPAQYLHQLNIINPQKRFSKRSPGDRTTAAARLIRVAELYGIKIHPELEVLIREGFGSKKDGEDRFDAVLGLLGMLRFFTGMDQLPEPEAQRSPKLKAGSWDSHAGRLLYNHGMKPNTSIGRYRITNLVVMSGSNQIGRNGVRLPLHFISDTIHFPLWHG